MKKVLILALTLCMGWQVSAYAAQREVVVTLDGKPVTLAEEPVYVEDRMMLPVRALAETLQASVSWDSASRTATVKKEMDGVENAAGEPFVWQVSMGLDSKYLTLMERTQLLLKNTPLLLHDRAYLPFRELAEAMNLGVSWSTDGTTDFVALTSPELPEVTLSVKGAYDKEKKSVSMEWKNSEDVTFFYGADYRLERWEEDRWQPVAPKDGLVTVDLAYLIGKGSTVSEFSLWGWENSLSPGKYRLAVPYRCNDENGADFFTLSQTAAYDGTASTIYTAYGVFSIS
ncbi:copper amine oxidase N-terminal domain-containing protein [Anaerotignum lactatifermentans]|uniref:Copper amine oxidase N-terminal domain-containing protein n=1 Tax=Anaerotignum lactatifermentans TaxID=160404 RepID=A0ABS2G7E5_9FIRM|nr:copper amine oxidase N-terminal domain-containing protein [Anaerotignum lactatifermentans]MBM6828788.1 copper amine oxidase N-terminal domain-containing protein [Anaerotignum lactatifermentans]MBM6877115.1 copper amine oxidase N-terminal domain-containing protein [Anaerotignum lactatifermentans]MBM6950370.1 copper amine oxidase N-terminal domain-containing protein [Anaerotignum lactatifermentans]